MALKKRYLEHLNRMRRMMAIYGLGPSDVTNMLGDNETRNALGRCITCDSVCPCEAYLADGENADAPVFCPNLQLIEALAAQLDGDPRQARSESADVSAWHSIDRRGVRFGASA
ncbi:DUF6455 family protein [Afifella sp. YEN Y35]|uniref:DUF6455 family protein n=1 Tax=Afifella sp. YEN Y35 TaxID=3388337 RepID=UPI0039E1A1CA